VIAKAKHGLKGAHILRQGLGGCHPRRAHGRGAGQGDTIIENAATEPEIGDVAECLVKMGAKIEGIHTPTLKIRGVTSLHGAEHSVIPDRIEAGTYAMCAGMTGGDVTLRGCQCRASGRRHRHHARGRHHGDTTNEGLRIRRNGQESCPVKVDTEPYPGFPTDCQAQLMGLMTKANGTSHHPRDDLRKPLHACAGAGPPRRRHSPAWRHGGGARREEAHRRST
jgi:UDP-N-acetylglucosamine 1-carboxyvinyltransferase